MASFFDTNTSLDESIFRYEYFQSSLHGDGVRSLENIPKNSTITYEKPVLVLQSIPNKHDIFACSNCFRFLGSLDFQIDYLLKKVSRYDLVTNNEQWSGIVSCEFGCGECYCCYKCRDSHWIRSHRLLCTGLVPAEDADMSSLVSFKRYAVETNEILLLCGELFSSICLSIENYISNGLSIDEAWKITTAPFERYVRNLWWDAAIAPAGTDPRELNQSLKQIVKDCWDLLNDFLNLKGRGLESYLTPEYIARTIGMFEQNNVGIRLESQLASIISNIKSDCVGFEDKITYYFNVTTAIVKQLSSEEAEDCDYEDIDDDDDDQEENDMEADETNSLEDGDLDFSTTANANPTVSLAQLERMIQREGGYDRLFPPLDGTAFYFLICKINHSCDPNVMVKYEESPIHGLRAYLIALRDISLGEELVQSYIDQSLPYKWRQKALEDYGFKCVCSKCISENNGK